MIPFKQYFLTEVKDTRRNREELIRAYGLTDHAPEHVANARASELIDKWTKLEPLINPDLDYFGDASSITGRGPYNPKDIFSWARVSKDFGWDKLEALQNLEAMMINLSREKDKKAETKLSEKDYDTVYDTEHATLYRPKSEAASCKLGAGTKWCTAATQGGNQFDSYTAQGVVLFYAIVKATQEKFAIAMYPGGEVFEVFDSEDNKIGWSQWEDKAMELGLPTDVSFYKKHGPSAFALLQSDVNQARSIMSGQTERDPYDPQSNWELLDGVLKRVALIFKEQDKEQIEQFKNYRKNEGMPDEVFLMDVLEDASMKYFLDREYNPSGSNDWSNNQFQQEIVRMISRATTLAKQANNDDTYNEDDFLDWERLTRRIYGPTDGDESRNRQHELRLYIFRHMSDKWPELEQALINMWVTNHQDTGALIDHSGTSETTREPFGDSLMWLRLMMDVKNGEWPELEQAIHGMIKNTLHNASKMEPRKLQDRTDGLVNMGVNYNLHTNMRKGLDVTDYKDWVPSSDEQLKRYADGEWDIDGPPLSDRAKRARKDKGVGEQTQHYLNDL